MGIGFWIKRFFTVFSVATLILAAVELLFKNAELVAAVTHGLTWGVIAAAVFTASRYYQAKKGQHCALCNDIPEKQ
jgi:hypothetical protein